MSKKKKKKEKITYIDDGSSFTDMSSTYGPLHNASKRPKASSSSRFKDILITYFDSVRMMFLPMLVTIGIISLAFLILWLLFGIK